MRRRRVACLRCKLVTLAIFLHKHVRVWQAPATSLALSSAVAALDLAHSGTALVFGNAPDVSLLVQARVWHVGSATISRICGMLADQSDDITQVCILWSTATSMVPLHLEPD